MSLFSRPYSFYRILDEDIYIYKETVPHQCFSQNLYCVEISSYLEFFGCTTPQIQMAKLDMD